MALLPAASTHRLVMRFESLRLLQSDGSSLSVLPIGAVFQVGVHRGVETGGVKGGGGGVVICFSAVAKPCRSNEEGLIRLIRLSLIVFISGAPGVAGVISGAVIKRSGVLFLIIIRHRGSISRLHTCLRVAGSRRRRSPCSSSRTEDGGRDGGGGGGGGGDLCRHGRG